MKLRDIQSTYEASSGKASDLVRYLGFAGIAIIWVFKSDSPQGQSLPSSLYWPAALIVASLALDLFQYVTHALTYWLYFRCLEKNAAIGRESELQSPVWLPWPFWTAWIAKALFVLVAYGLLLAFLFKTLRFQ